MERIITRLSHPKEVAVQAAKTTLKITTAPFHMWMRACLVILHLVGLTLTTPQRLLQRIVSSVNSVMGSKLSTRIDSVSESSKALERETRDLKLRLEMFEDGLRKAEKLRENTFEEMRDIRSEVAQIFDALQDRNSRARKTRPSRTPATSNIDTKRSETSLPKWLSHISVGLALSMMWNFFLQGQFDKSVERKLLLCLCFPMLWLYTKSLFRPNSSEGGEDTKNHFIISNIAFFVIGFVCCDYFHLPKGTTAK